MDFRQYGLLVYVMFVSFLPLIYTQNVPQDYVNVRKFARKEVGFYTEYNAPDDDDAPEPDDGNVTSQPEDYVNAHNVAREEVGAEPIEWNITIAEYAQNYANQKTDCVLEHSDGDGGRYAENIAWGGVAKDAVTMWVGEKADWDAASQTCAPGKVCGHYTNVIAPDSTQLGCGRVKCTTQKYAYFVTCNYYAPPKNLV